MTGEEIEGLFENILSEIRFIPAKRIETLMYEAGFDDIEPFYGTLLLGGWVARKSVGIRGAARSVHNPLSRPGLGCATEALTV